MAIDPFRRPEAFGPIFEVRIEDENGLAHVRLHGELDIAAVPLLELECKRIEEGGGQIAALDLEKLTFIDAAGLGAVISAEARARMDGRALPVLSADGDVRKVFELTGNGGLLISISPPPVTPNGDYRG